MTSGEEDFTKRMVGKLDLRWINGVPFITPTVAGCLPVSIEHIVEISHEQILGVALKTPTVAQCLPISIEHVVEISHEEILGVALKTPTVAQCVPTSIENAAIAYDAINDRFKVDIEAMSVGTIQVDVADEWNRQLGLVDLSRVLGAALSHSNPVIARLTDGSAFIDPRDVSDRAARLLGVVYGSLDKLQQQDTTNELLVQISHQGVIKDPTAIRALTSSDQITVVQATAANLLATVTQAAKDRTITDITKTGTLKQISVTHTGANSTAVWDPATGKKVRLKFLSIEVSAAVDVGFRFTATGTIYYCRTTAGPWAGNMIGCYPEGGTDEDLYIYTSGAATVKGFADGEEV